MINYGPNNSWISSPYPKDNSDGRLYVWIVAIDPAVVKLGSKLTIPTLPVPWNTKTFTATDTGRIWVRLLGWYCRTEL